MYEHHGYLDQYGYVDRYYAEQVIACCDPRREAPQEIVVPIRWIAAWFAAVSGVGFGLAALVNWLS